MRAEIDVFSSVLCVHLEIEVCVCVCVWSTKLNIPSEYTQYLSCWHMEVVSFSLVHVSDLSHVAIEVKSCL